MATALLWIGTDDQRHCIVEPMVQRFHRRKECIEVTMNQHAMPLGLNRSRLLNHNETYAPAVFELDVYSVQVEGCSQAWITPESHLQ